MEWQTVMVQRMRLGVISIHVTMVSGVTSLTLVSTPPALRYAQVVFNVNYLQMDKFPLQEALDSIVMMDLTRHIVREDTTQDALLRQNLAW